jgi:hypothetical protein
MKSALGGDQAAVERLIDQLLDLLEVIDPPLEVTIPALAAVSAVALEEYAALHRVAVPGVVQAILRELDTYALFQRTRGRSH